MKCPPNDRKAEVLLKSAVPRVRLNFPHCRPGEDSGESGIGTFNLSSHRILRPLA